ncbi:hypothetical protein ABW20_dc0105021 [Dactylellina cionopaga]|nr:hypothetical protein ABW20_dc0105021 [Dactylellina cionopaga]
MGIPCPAVYFVDEKQGEIIMEWIDGPSIRDFLHTSIEDTQDSSNNGVDTEFLMGKIGEIIGKLHDVDIVHGDLTTSNLMLRKQLQHYHPCDDDTEQKEQTTSIITQGRYEVVLIDFGLGQVSTSDEDKAVDLYVLERAFISTHPKASRLFHIILEAYKQSSIGSAVVLRRLQEVRLRGRKKSMLG